MSKIETKPCNFDILYCVMRRPCVSGRFPPTDQPGPGGAGGRQGGQHQVSSQRGVARTQAGRRSAVERQSATAVQPNIAERSVLQIRYMHIFLVLMIYIYIAYLFSFQKMEISKEQYQILIVSLNSKV